MTQDQNVEALKDIFREFVPSLGKALAMQSGKLRQLPMTQGTGTSEQIFKLTDDVVVHICEFSDEAVAPIHSHETSECLFALTGSFFISEDNGAFREIKQHKFVCVDPGVNHHLYMPKAITMLVVLMPNDNEFNWD